MKGKGQEKKRRMKERKKRVKKRRKEVWEIFYHNESEG